MTARHRPPPATLRALAEGRLGAEASLVVLAHLALDEGSRAAFEALCPPLLAETPAELAPDALERALGRLDAPAPTPEAASGARPGRWVGPGLRFVTLSRGRGGAWAGLLTVQEGAEVPPHGHAGVERICVLRGAYEEGDEVHRAGDYAESGEESHHAQRALPGGCDCLIAGEGGLRFRGWLPRLWAPFTPFRG